jgi:hypothetical protein
MRHGHGKTSNTAGERVRRATQPARDRVKEEQNRQRSRRGGQPDELGVIQGQNGEQGNTVNSRIAQKSGKIRH